jgi:hypothetical protein
MTGKMRAESQQNHHDPRDSGETGEWIAGKDVKNGADHCSRAVYDHQITEEIRLVPVQTGYQKICRKRYS